MATITVSLGFACSDRKGASKSLTPELLSGKVLRKHAPLRAAAPSRMRLHCPFQRIKLIEGSRANRFEQGRALVVMGLFGAALIHGDGIITLVISVLSAIQSVNVATSALMRYVMSRSSRRR